MAVCESEISGATRYHAGTAAEESVKNFYEAKGYRLRHQRWRCKAGEIDLILQRADTIVFVEVKQSKSFERAASRISRAQVGRIMTAASVFLDGEPLGQLTPSRLDAALVNASGGISIVENGLAFF